MHNPIHIKKATIEDRATIVSLGKRTFRETYPELIQHPDVQEYLKHKFSDESVEHDLNHPMSRFYIGYVHHAPVAFTRLRFDRTAEGLCSNKMIELEQIYVLKEYQGFKVGKEMMDKCKQIAMDERFDTLWLQVWQQNQKAIQFYQKAGFVVYETAQFSYGKNLLQEDFLMRLDFYY